jgi:type II secretory pathway pseudopilin PulG
MQHPVIQGRAGEAGYNMVMLVVAITLLSIVVAAVLPLMSTEIRREKEEELIFRGFQYAEAIRIFHQKNSRYPVKLEELLEVKPRVIRQLWKDPMTKDGKWGLIFQNQGNPLQAQNPNDPNNPNPQNPPGPNANGPQPTPDPNAGGDPSDPNNPTPGLNGPQKGDVVAVGPIVGVYSKSPKSSFLVFYGHNRYDEWRFTEDLIRQGSGRQSTIAGIGNPNANVTPNYSTRWLGRPMQFVDQAQPQNGTMPSDPSKPTKSSGKP